LSAHTENPSTAKSFTWKEVAEHNTAASCWVSVHGKVYDITSKSVVLVIFEKIFMV